MSSSRVSSGYIKIAQLTEWWTVVVCELLWSLTCVRSEPVRHPSVTDLNMVCKTFSCAPISRRLDKGSAENVAHWSWAYVSYNQKDKFDISQRITKSFQNMRMLKNLWQCPQQDVHSKYMFFLVMFCSQHDCYKAVAIHRKSGALKLSLCVIQSERKFWYHSKDNQSISEYGDAEEPMGMLSTGNSL